jgi:hypothetical protein
LKTEVNDLYNKLNQKYEILGRFFITGKEYCRVKFTTTKHEDVVPADRISNGDFEDTSIATPKSTKKDQEVFKNLEERLEQSDSKIEPSAEISKSESKVSVTAESISLKVSQDDFTEEDKVSKIIATSPKGEDVEVEDLEAFCEENKLDIEVVNAVLEGNQKTHRKWRFTKA